MPGPLGRGITNAGCNTTRLVDLIVTLFTPLRLRDSARDFSQRRIQALSSASDALTVNWSLYFR